MKMPAQIRPWMSPEEMSAWVRKAPNLDSYKKRLAIWLTSRGTFHAHKVSDLLQISKQAVWLWVKQFNSGGPTGLERKGRGGRRHAYLNVDDERNLVNRLQSLVANGQARKAKELMPEVLKAVGQNVSLAYVYRLLQRYEKKREVKSPAPRAHPAQTRESGSGREDAESLIPHPTAASG